MGDPSGLWGLFLDVEVSLGKLCIGEVHLGAGCGKEGIYTVIAWRFRLRFCSLFEYFVKGLVVEKGPGVVEFVVPRPFQIAHCLDHAIYLVISYQREEGGVYSGRFGIVGCVVVCAPQMTIGLRNGYGDESVTVWMMEAKTYDRSLGHANPSRAPSSLDLGVWRAVRGSGKAGRGAIGRGGSRRLRERGGVLQMPSWAAGGPTPGHLVGDVGSLVEQDTKLISKNMIGSVHLIQRKLFTFASKGKAT